MKTKKLILGLMVLFLVLIAGSLYAQNPTSLAPYCGMVINTPGNYVLGGDLVGCSKNWAIKIQADDVTLDLNENLISGNGKNSGIYIVGASRVTIKNGRIENFYGGILSTYRQVSHHWYKYPDDIVIENNLIQNNNYGVYLNPEGKKCGGHQILNNQIEGNTYGGVILKKVINAEIVGNTIIKNGTYGIYASDSEGLSISQNRVSENRYGITFKNVDLSKIFENAICNNETGVSIACHYDEIYHNNFIANKRHALDDEHDNPSNRWYENFWSDHHCHSPYQIYGKSHLKDKTPLCAPWPKAPSCEEATGSICGFKFNDLDGNGTWTTSEAPIFRDDFGDNAMNGWAPKRGTWLETAGFLEQTETGGACYDSDGLILYETQNFIGISYAAQMTPVNGDRDFGLVFLASDDTHYTLFKVDGANGSIGVFRRSGTQVETLANMRLSDVGFPYTVLNNGETYEMKVSLSLDENQVGLYFGTTRNLPATPLFTLDLCGETLCRSGYVGLYTKGSAVNFDWVQVSGEPGIKGWQISLSLEGTVQRTVETASDGSYCFTSLPKGTYKVSEVLKEGWVQTYPAGGVHSVVLGEGQSVGCLNFGNMESKPFAALEVSTAVDVSGERFYDWTIDKTITKEKKKKADLTLGKGKSADVEYTVDVERTIKEDKYYVEGTITAKNVGISDALVVAVKNCMEPELVICQIIQTGGTVQAGETVSWPFTYEFTPVDSSLKSYTNRAEVTISNAVDGQHTYFSYVTFELPTNLKETDQTATVTDEMSCPLGLTCSGTGPLLFPSTDPGICSGDPSKTSCSESYLVTITNELLCAQDLVVDNTATLEENDTKQKTQSSAELTISTETCKWPCTYPLRYWWIYSGVGTQDDKVGPLLPIWLGTPGAPGVAKSIYVNESPEAYMILDEGLKVEEEIIYGDGYATDLAYNGLSGELLAAKLNIKYGSNGEAIISTIYAVDSILAAYDDEDFQDGDVPVGILDEVETLWQTLYDYNIGDIGPGTCLR